VVVGAFASPSDCEQWADPADRLAAASWLTGGELVSPKPSPDLIAGFYDLDILSDATQRWQGLRQLPDNEALARVVALRRAAATCSAGKAMLTVSKR
jgi:hypothetical protein